jgi:hypothetical protein
MSPGAPPSPVANAPVAWQYQPLLMKLRRVVSSEQACCWALVTIAGLSFVPVGYWLAFGLIALFPVLLELSNQTLLPNWLQSLLAPLSAIGLTGAPLAMLGGLAAPVIVVLWGLMVYRRMLRTATSDLVWGQAALMLTDDGYGMLIEEARREHFRPTINAVEIGNGLLSRLNHFAHYYSSYYRLSRGPCELALPIVVERNCWMDGVPAGLGGCMNICVGAGLPLALPMLLRIVLTWPRLVAIKQAALDYFSGRYDHLLEQQYVSRAAGKQ